MLVKWTASLAERQEGVAFFGRAGTAILKSVQRLGIDPLRLYGTLCVKCTHLDPAEVARSSARRGCPREIHIVQPSPDRRRWASAWWRRSTAWSSRSREPIRPETGVVQRWTPTIEALYVPDIDASLDEQAAKRVVLGGVPGHRRLAPGPAALLTPTVAATLIPSGGRADAAADGERMAELQSTAQALRAQLRKERALPRARACGTSGGIRRPPSRPRPSASPRRPTAQSEDRLRGVRRVRVAPRPGRGQRPVPGPLPVRAAALGPNALPRLPAHPPVRRRAGRELGLLARDVIQLARLRSR